MNLSELVGIDSQDVFFSVTHLFLAGLELLGTVGQ